MNQTTTLTFKGLAMASGDFNEWGPKRIEEHNRRISDLEADRKMMIFRIEQAESNHKETMKAINEFIGETRASFSNVQSDLHKKLSTLHEKMNGVQNTVSQGVGVAAAWRVLVPLLAAGVGGLVTYLAGRV